MRFLPLVFALALASTTVAQNATLSVIHGIPKLPQPVEVLANGNSLFKFDFGDVRGPLSLKPGSYRVQVKLGDTVVLDRTAKLDANKNYTAVAHLTARNTNALAFFLNDTSKTRTGRARLAVRHLAVAPAVDVLARRFFFTSRIVRNLSNPNEAKTEVRSGTYSVSINAAGTNTRAFGPVRLSLRSNNLYNVHAVGRLSDKTFRLIVQAIDLTGPVSYKATVQGKACGGKIGISTKAPEVDKAFQLILTGGTKNGRGILHVGNSDRRFLFLRLPASLSFLGARGCFLYQNTPLLIPVRLDANGGVRTNYRITKAASRYTRELHFQYSFVAPGKNRLGVLFTDYATVER